MNTSEYGKREECIRTIRSLLPYADERALERIVSIARCATRHSAFSHAEYARPVLSVEEQERADAAARCVGSICDALLDGEYSFEQETGKVQLGRIDGSIAVLDASEVIWIYKDAGWRHIKRDLLFLGLEEYGFILPRSSRPKTAVINGKRREVLYVPCQKIQEVAACAI